MLKSWTARSRLGSIMCTAALELNVAVRYLTSYYLLLLQHFTELRAIV
jgi:hypothetical protein